MTSKQNGSVSFDCAECGMLVQPATAHHPFLYCELYKLRHYDPEHYLATYGFTRNIVKEGSA